jgi:lipoic acid synthetase
MTDEVAPAAGETNADQPLPFRHRRPEWLRVRAPWGEGFEAVRRLVHGQGLHTVCEEARCPNIGECWGAGTGTFLILGDVCTRSCAFCAVKTGRPAAPDAGEPERVAEAVRRMGLRHAVITSVDRDDLPDGGASAFAACVGRIRVLAPDCSVEVLVPDFKGSREALGVVMDSRPHVLGHNVETVPRLYRAVRPQASYQRSLDMLARVKEMDGAVLSKTGIMVGLGETEAEVVAVMRDLAAARVDILTVGQYLRPTEGHRPISRYFEPADFDRLREVGLHAGLAWVEAGPLVRSSYHADRQVAALRGTAHG